MITRPEALGRWKGVLIPIVTPFTKTGELNLSALYDNTRWLIERGATLGNSILLAAGSGGDFTSMNVTERIEVISTIARASAGALPVIAGAQSLDIRESVEICQACEALGVDGVQISGPYYYDGRPGDVIAWLETIASQTSIAFALYNNWYTGYNMPLTLVERLLEIPNVSGLKWSAPDMPTFFEGVRRFAGKLAVINNTFNAVPGYLAGCTAFVSHIPNFWPEFGWRILDLMESDRYEEAQAEFDRVMEPYEALVGQIRRPRGWPLTAALARRGHRRGATGDVLPLRQHLCHQRAGIIGG